MEVRFENGWVDRWPFGRFNGFLTEMPKVERKVLPAVDVIEDKDAYHFYFEMPGLKSDAFDVKVENGTLIVAAERKRAELPKDAAVHVSERHWGSYKRAFELPEDASHDRINASYRDGVLELTIEKRAESKPVKIQIN
jgi:HSP20 family protein